LAAGLSAGDWAPAEVVGQGVAVDAVAAPLALGDELAVEDFLDLVAVQAASADGGAVAEEARLVVVARGEARGVLVGLEDGLHGVAQALQGHAALGAGGVAAAVAGVDFLVGVQKEDHEGQVVIELEEAQVGEVDAREANADELFGLGLDLVETDNLPVKFMAVRSGDAAEDDHEGLAGAAGGVEASLVAGQPAVLGAGLAAAAAGLGGGQRRGEQAGQGGEQGEAGHGRSPGIRGGDGVLW